MAEANGKNGNGNGSNGKKYLDKINVWTQAFIAGAVVGVTLAVCILMVVRGNYVEITLQLLGNAFFLIVGFYFAKKDNPEDVMKNIIKKLPEQTNG